MSHKHSPESFVISDEKIDEQDKLKQTEEKDIKKLMIDDEEEDRKLLESIPDESKSRLMLILSKVLCHEYVVVRSILYLSHLYLVPYPYTKSSSGVITNIYINSITEIFGDFCRH